MAEWMREVRELTDNARCRMVNQVNIALHCLFSLLQHAQFSSKVQGHFRCDVAPKGEVSGNVGQTHHTAPRVLGHVHAKMIVDAHHLTDHFLCPVRNST